MRRYGNPIRTKKDKRAMALQFVVMSSRTDEEKVQSLVSSYGFTEPEAHEFVRKHSG